MKSLVALVGTKSLGPEIVALLASLPAGEKLTMKRKSDEVQVYARGRHVGRVPKGQDRSITSAIALGAMITDAKAPLPGMEVQGELVIDSGGLPLIEVDMGGSE